MLTRTGMHAVRALMALARLPHRDYAGVAHIARAIAAPQNYLGKLLKVLADEGLLESQKGLGGGFRLGKDAQEISLFDVVEPLEHVSRWAGCILGQKECSDEAACPLHEQWKGVRGAYLRMLTETTLADLVRKGERATVTV